MNDLSSFRHILTSFLGCFVEDIEEYTSRRIQLQLPNFEAEDIMSILNRTISILSGESTVLELELPVHIASDIHGNLIDVIRMFKQCGFPQDTRYLFLGDTIDRGEFSLEVIILLFLCKIVYPDNIFFVRGNHEAELKCTSSTFLSELNSMYQSDRIIHRFAVAFSYLPFAAIVDGRFFCVHGGICPDIMDLTKLKNLRRPTDATLSDGFKACFWSDPTTITKGFRNSPRGLGFLFGEAKVQEFLSRNNLQLIIRGHEHVQDGYKTQFNNTVITISSSSASTRVGNVVAGIMRITSEEGIEMILLDPVAYLPRKNVAFVSNTVSKITHSSSTSNIRLNSVAHIPRAISGLGNTRLFSESPKIPKIPKTPSTASPHVFAAGVNAQSWRRSKGGSSTSMSGFVFMQQTKSLVFK